MGDSFPALQQVAKDWTEAGYDTRAGKLKDGCHLVAVLYPAIQKDMPDLSEAETRRYAFDLALKLLLLLVAATVFMILPGLALAGGAATATGPAVALSWVELMIAILILVSVLIPLAWKIYVLIEGVRQGRCDRAALKEVVDAVGEVRRAGGNVQDVLHGMKLREGRVGAPVVAAWKSAVQSKDPGRHKRLASRQ